MMVSKFQEFFVKEEKGTRRRRRITGEFLTLRFDVTTLTCVAGLRGVLFFVRALLELLLFLKTRRFLNLYYYRSCQKSLILLITN